MLEKEFSYMYEQGVLPEDKLLYLAQNTKSPEILTVLATDKHWRVRKWVSHNPYVPPEIMATPSMMYFVNKRNITLDDFKDQYAKKNFTEDDLVYIAELTHSPEILTILSTSESVSIRIAVASNPNTPGEILSFYLDEPQHHSVLEAVREENTAHKYDFDYDCSYVPRWAKIVGYSFLVGFIGLLVWAFI